MKSLSVRFNAKHWCGPGEDAIRRAGEKYGEETGSGMGFGERDISFDVPNNSVARAKAAILKAAKKQGVRVRMEVEEDEP